MATIEQAVGIGIMLLFLTDIFVTVLYARANAGILAPRLGRLIWRVFRVVGGSLGRPADVLSFCGPAILITAVAFWAFGLTLGAALIIHPELGHGVVSGSGETGTDFLTALEAGGASLAIVGAGDHSPAAASMQLLYLFDSLIGVSVLSLTLTYLMQVYTALRERNVVAMDLHLLTAETDDAAELLVRLAPDGDPGRAVDALAQLGGRITAGKEAHHFYPVLSWFRFPEPHYAVSRIALLGLDTVALIRTALDPRRAPGLPESAAIEQLARGSWLLLTTVERAILGHAADPKAAPDDDERSRRRYGEAVRRLGAAGFPVVTDEHTGAEAYAALRASWAPHVRIVADAMSYDVRAIDPAGEGADLPAEIGRDANGSLPRDRR
jgi:hypothetical protein